MTKHKGFKRVARSLAKRTGRSYAGSKQALQRGEVQAAKPVDSEPKVVEIEGEPAEVENQAIKSKRIADGLTSTADRFTSKVDRLTKPVADSHRQDAYAFFAKAQETTLIQKTIDALNAPIGMKTQTTIDALNAPIGMMKVIDAFSDAVQRRGAIDKVMTSVTKVAQPGRAVTELMESSRNLFEKMGGAGAMGRLDQVMKTHEHFARLQKNPATDFQDAMSRAGISKMMDLTASMNQHQAPWDAMADAGLSKMTDLADAMSKTSFVRSIEDSSLAKLHREMQGPALSLHDSAIQQLRDLQESLIPEDSFAGLRKTLLAQKRALSPFGELAAQRKRVSKKKKTVTKKAPKK